MAIVYKEPISTGDSKSRYLCPYCKEAFRYKVTCRLHMVAHKREAEEGVEEINIG